MIATSPSSTGDQNWPKRSASFAISPRKYGPKIVVPSRPAKRTVRSASAFGSCIATRSAAAPGEPISMRATLPPSLSSVQASSCSRTVRVADGSSRPNPTASALLPARGLRPRESHCAPERRPLRRSGRRGVDPARGRDLRANARTGGAEVAVLAGRIPQAARR